MKEIEKINDDIDGITVLSGIEANIDSEGKLDVKNEVLQDLDIVVASIHSGFKSSEKEMTNRIINAMQNDYVTIIGHPTGRKLNQREPYEVNLSKIFEEAEQRGIFLELNSFPERLDLTDLGCMKARDYGILISINTDSHSRDQLRFMELGVATARRGWLEKKNVVNTRNLQELKKLL
jgi:DNA polymerase (family 10)